ncbi:hypothetical protein OG765_16770 [Streptomyces sp. NBC_00555]|uniref:hypothetical protein n=1 Tax=Streptomyces sp. NBC_00555 TaxID=2903662 RepID=UPI0022501D2C|nr:hypothetical protein [Streptomyces sp. NBC_00555]MCX5012642.1 hypothetical protein [Streptomyces sp. NBC_00555]
MSTPEEQQQYERQQQYEQQQQPQYEQPQYEQQPQQHQDPYGTQTWQTDTWDTGYQPVQPPLGGVPGQPVAPEGWFRDEAPAAEQTAYLPPAAPAPAAPDGWFRDEVPAPAPAQDWSQAAPAAPAAEQTAYLPPYPGPGHDPGSAQQPAAPEGWFRDEAPVPAPAPAADWAETTAWGPLPAVAGGLPPQAEPPVEQTAYLPPVAPAPEPPVLAEPPVLPAPPEAAGEEPEYSPPTLGGNTVRAVDPTQARAEGRSPIIDPGPQPAILTAVLGVLLAVAAAVGQYALLVPLIALQGLTAAGWFRLNGMWPARQGIALAFAGALVADVAVLAVDEAYGPGAIIGTLGAWVLLTLVLQLRSHADPDERMYGLMASVASAALAIVCAGYLAADTAAVTVGAAAVAVAVFARALPLPPAPSFAVSLAAAAGAGIAVGPMAGVGVGGGALLGLVAGVCALIGLRVAAYDYPSKFVHMTAGVALPLAAAAPAVYLIGRVVG